MSAEKKIEKRNDDIDKIMGLVEKYARYCHEYSKFKEAEDNQTLFKACRDTRNLIEAKILAFSAQVRIL